MPGQALLDLREAGGQITAFPLKSNPYAEFPCRLVVGG